MHKFTELRYISRFSCLGAACPDHCCKDWEIEIDPGTERRYRALEDQPLRQALTASLVRRRRADGQKASFLALRADGLCPMQEPDGLCRVQKTLGEAYLSHCCDSFPRLLTGTERHGFRAGSVACPEVAREVLQAPDAMAEVGHGDAPGWTPPAAARPARGPLLSIDEMAAVRTCMLGILTATRQPWAGRITAATLFCRDLAGIILARDRGALTLLTMRMHEVVATADLGGVVAAEAGAEDRLGRSRVTMLRLVASQDRWAGTPHASFVQRAADGLDLHGAPRDEVAASLTRLDRERLMPALAARPHLAGNLFANFLLQRGFPAGRPGQAMVRFWEAALCFTLWRMLMAGHLAHDAGSDFDAIAQGVTYRTGRLLMHSANLLGDLRRILEQHGMVEDPTLVALLR